MYIIIDLFDSFQEMTQCLLLHCTYPGYDVTMLAVQFVLNVTGDVVNNVLSDLKSQIPLELTPFVPSGVSVSSVCSSLCLL